MNPCLKPTYRPPLRERIRVAGQNWKVRKTGRAMRHLAHELQTDPGYRLVWHANLACEIYNTHQVGGKLTRLRDKDADLIADRILKRFFNA